MNKDNNELVSKAMDKVGIGIHLEGAAAAISVSVSIVSVSLAVVLCCYINNGCPRIMKSNN